MLNNPAMPCFRPTTAPRGDYSLMVRINEAETEFLELNMIKTRIKANESKKTNFLTEERKYITTNNEDQDQNLKESEEKP